MKVRIIMHTVLGFISTWLIVSITGRDLLPALLMLIPPIGFLHELLHLIVIKAYKLRYGLVVNGLYIGFKTEFKNVKQLIVAASAPQILTASLIALYTVTMSYIVLGLSLIHLAISSEDIIKIAKYAIDYSA